METRKKRLSRKEALTGLCLAVIPLVGFTLFGLIPMVISVFMSFMKITGFGFEGATFVGLGNYKFIFSDPLFLKAIGNTFYNALGVPITIALSVLIAAFIGSIVRFRKVFRMIFFIPYVCSVVAVSAMWRWMFNETFGIFNSALAWLNIGPVGWLTDEKTIMPSMILMSVWSGLGYNVLLSMAALTNVNKAYYEAAAIDGAGPIRKFFNITLPAVSPTLFYLLVIGLIGSLQDFARFQIMLGNNGGAGQAGMTLVFYLWQKGFSQFIVYGFGVASAVAWALTILIMLITLINSALSKVWVHYDE